MGACITKESPANKLKNVKPVELDSADIAIIKLKKFNKMASDTTEKYEIVDQRRQSLRELKDVYKTQKKRKSIKEVNFKLARISKSMRDLNNICEDLEGKKRRFSEMINRNQVQSKSFESC